jgi:alkylation response protein AidB-like acyl-CoA dehydrogenase
VAAGTRSEAKRWYQKTWDPDRTVGDWFALLANSGWGYPGWPTEWFGRGMDRVDVRAVREERKKLGALAPPSGIGPSLLAPMLFRHGTDDQMRRFLPAMAWKGETFCQMLSEPEAGSDLAGVTTTATLDGDEWVINGSKIWTSKANEVHYGMLLARTDPDAPKHRGLTFFLIARDQPGIDVRPLRTMTGAASFNQVFFDDARISVDDVIGAPEDGWTVTRTFLALETNSYNPDAHEGGPFGKVDLHQTCAQLQQREQARRSAAAQGRGAGQLITDLIDKHGHDITELTRARRARLHTWRRVMGYTNQRVRASRRQGNSLPGFEGPMSKLTVSTITREQRDLGLETQGPHGMLADEHGPSGQFHHFFLSSPAISIAGGTDEIQRNHLAERILGLPKEPLFDPNSVVVEDKKT